jgi:streptogramin lyase
MRSLLLAASASALALPAFAQTSYWIANRASLDIMRVSEWGSVLERVLTPAAGLRSANKAPDGKVWIVRFIQTTFDIYDPATQTFTQFTSPNGSVSNIAFDAAGTAWITTNLNVVHQFDANGLFLQTINLPVSNAQGITIDGLDNKWIAHRIAPASLTRVDSAGVATNFPITGAAAAFLPIGPIADYRGAGQPSHIWVTGDSATSLAEIDGATGATLNVYVMPMASVAYPPTFDLAGRIWVSSFGNGTIVQIDQTNGSVLNTLTLPPNNIGISTDNFGRIRAVSRVTFSGVGPPCEVRRIDAFTGALEIPTKLTFGGFDAAGTPGAMNTQFQYSLVVAPNGDLDNDGVPNALEVLNGGSPTDPTSSPGFRVESFGVTQNGSTPTIDVLTSAGQLWLVGFATALIAPTPVPGFGGNLLLDPTTLLTTTAGIGSVSAPIAIPADPSLIDLQLFVQGVTFNGVGFDFQNVSGLMIW